MQRKPFSECFFVMALAQAYVTAARGGANSANTAFPSAASYLDRAEAVLDSIISWSDDPSLIGRPTLPGQSPLSPLAVPMILLNVIDEVCSAADAVAAAARGGSG